MLVPGIYWHFHFHTGNSATFPPYQCSKCPNQACPCLAFCCLGNHAQWCSGLTHGTVLPDHFWQAQGTPWDAGERSQAGSLEQGKCDHLLWYYCDPSLAFYTLHNTSLLYSTFSKEMTFYINMIVWTLNIFRFLAIIIMHSHMA